MKVRELGRRVLMVGLGVAVTGVVVFWQPSPGSAVTFSQACINSAIADAAQVNVTLTGNAPASVEAGASFQLTNISQTVALPGSLFVAGYNLGLLVVGTNNIPGTSKMVIEGTNTVQVTQTTPAVSVLVTVTITDPDGIPGSGDESATNATVTTTYPDQTWTAGPAGAIEFREDTVTPLSTTVGGIVITATIGGIITVQFGCDPGTVGPGGLITLTDPAPSFASTTSVAPIQKGDVDCDGDIDAVDALKGLRHVAGLSVAQNQGCGPMGAVGNVDCDSDADAVDALRILRYVAGLNPNLPGGCPPIGS